MIRPHAVESRTLLLLTFNLRHGQTCQQVVQAHHPPLVSWRWWCTILVDRRGQGRAWHSLFNRRRWAVPRLLECCCSLLGEAVGSEPDTIPCHTMPCHAMPCHAMPCHAMPCHHTLVVLQHMNYLSCCVLRHRARIEHDAVAIASRTPARSVRLRCRAEPGVPQEGCFKVATMTPLGGDPCALAPAAVDPQHPRASPTGADAAGLVSTRLLLKCRSASTVVARTWVELVLGTFPGRRVTP